MGKVRKAVEETAAKMAPDAFASCTSAEMRRMSGELAKAGEEERARRKKLKIPSITKIEGKIYWRLPDGRCLPREEAESVWNAMKNKPEIGPVVDMDAVREKKASKAKCGAPVVDVAKLSLKMAREM